MGKRIIVDDEYRNFRKAGHDKEVAMLRVFERLCDQLDADMKHISDFKDAIGQHGASVMRLEKQLLSARSLNLDAYIDRVNSFHNLSGKMCSQINELIEQLKNLSTPERDELHAATTEVKRLTAVIDAQKKKAPVASIEVGAAVLGVSTEWLKSEIDAGRLPGLKAEPAYIICPEELLSAVKRLASGPAKSRAVKRGDWVGDEEPSP